MTDFIDRHILKFLVCYGLVVFIGVPWTIVAEHRDRKTERWTVVDSAGERYDVEGPVHRGDKNDAVSFEYKGRSITLYAPRRLERIR